MALLKVQQKRLFDINSKQDLQVFANYLKKSSWSPNGCPFETEYPWVSLPDMVKDKITRKYLETNNVSI